MFTHGRFLTILSIMEVPLIYYFNSNNRNCHTLLCNQLQQLIIQRKTSSQPIILLCVGSDRSTGDSLGPIIGYKLQHKINGQFYIYGSLSHPVHAANLADTIHTIHKSYANPFIIAIDACLGKPNHIGYITLSDSPLKPGLGVKKKLPEVGDIHITGIVNSSGMLDHALLQTTHLSIIMTLADIIADAILLAFNPANDSHKPQVPLQWYPPVLTS